MKAPYKISEVARYFDISNQTLHYYDRIGLLRPSTVDPQTKYRYYDQQQFNKMFMIKELKRIGFSLEEIMAFEEHKNLESLGTVLQKNREELVKQIEELVSIQQRMEFYLDMIHLTGRAHRRMECEFREIPARHAFYINVNFELKDLSEYVEMLYKSYVKVAGLRLPRDLDNKMVLTMEQDMILRGKYKYYSGIGLLVPTPLKNSNGFELPAALYATATHVGDYGTLPETYKRVRSCIGERGYVIHGQAVEVSLINVVHTGNPEEFVTEIQIPVRPVGD